MTAATELPVSYALRVAQCGKRLVFQNGNVVYLHEVRLPQPPQPRPWPMEFEGREYADVDDARRAVNDLWAPWFFDTWEEAEAWLYEPEEAKP